MYVVFEIKIRDGRQYILTKALTIYNKFYHYFNIEKNYHKSVTIVITLRLKMDCDDSYTNIVILYSA